MRVQLFERTLTVAHACCYMRLCERFFTCASVWTVELHACTIVCAHIDSTQTCVPACICARSCICNQAYTCSCFCVHWLFAHVRVRAWLCGKVCFRDKCFFVDLGAGAILIVRTWLLAHGCVCACVCLHVFARSDVYVYISLFIKVHARTIVWTYIDCSHRHVLNLLLAKKYLRIQVFVRTRACA